MPDLRIEGTWIPFAAHGWKWLKTWIEVCYLQVMKYKSDIKRSTINRGPDTPGVVRDPHFRCHHAINVIEGGSFRVLSVSNLLLRMPIVFNRIHRNERVNVLKKILRIPGQPTMNTLKSCSPGWRTDMQRNISRWKYVTNFPYDPKV